MIPSNLLTSLLRGISQILSTPFPFPLVEDGSTRLGLASLNVTAPAGLPGVFDPEPPLEPTEAPHEASSASLFF